MELDLIVLGAGSGGTRCARIAGSLGAKVAVIERDRLGGTCVNVGCVPKKLLVIGGRYGESAKDARAFGWRFGEASHAWPVLRDAVAAEVARLNGVYQRLLDAAGVEVIRGTARVEGPNEVLVGDRVLRAPRVLVATGGHAWVPALPGIELALTSDAMFSLPTLPERIVIVGGGYIGVEFAGILHALGVDVTLVNPSPCVLTHFDHDVRAHLASEMQKQGIKLLLGRQVTALDDRAPGVRVHLDGGAHLDADQVLFATGRRPQTHGLGLERAGITLGPNGEVPVNERFQTVVPSIYAIGDVTGRVALTPMAIAEGHWLAATWFGGPSVPEPGLDLIPTAVFSRPNVGTVGLAEHEARARGLDLDVYVSTFRPMAHTLSGRDEKALMKLIVDRATDKVVGLHVVGDDAGEIVQGFAVAMRAGATKRDFDRTLGIHPTAAEELVTMRTPRP